ncbi:MAG: ATP synthase F1 subunit delta [Flavobacteriaceae bacterium]|nr:ATP synthase F1 subunit delta [Flavobacteriaceae bacterium]
MIRSRVAIRYAKALLDLSAEQNSLQQIDADMRHIAQSMTENPELLQLLKNPIVNRDVKKEELIAFYGDLTPLSLDMIGLLIRNKRIDLLDEVALQFMILYEKLKQEDVATVTTAIPLDKNLEEKLLKKLKMLTGNTVSLENIIDESILGGFILQMGDIQYNASIANSVEKLRKEFNKSI